jgi:hypothetical protein
MVEPPTTHEPAADEMTHEGMSPQDKATSAESMSGDEPYMLGSDSTVRDGVPRGEVAEYRQRSDYIYPGTERAYWLYVPAQYDGARPACLMVFQDAEFYLGPDANVPVAFDNLIHARAMPVTIGLFVSPGDKGPGLPIYRWGRQPERRIRRARRPVRALPDRGAAPGGRAALCRRPGPGQPGDLRDQLRRHLRLHGGLGAPRRLRQSGQPLRQLHQHTGRAHLPLPDP